MAVLQISISVHLLEFLSLSLCSLSCHFNDYLFGEASSTVISIDSKKTFFSLK